MSLLVVLLLAVIQGAFMFVPVSSTSHLALTQHLLGEEGVVIPPPDAAEMILFDLVLHVGTVVSIVVVLRRRLMDGLLRLASDVRLWRSGVRGLRRLPALRVAALLAVSTVVTGVAGFGVRSVAPGVFASPALIAVALVLTGAILWWTDYAPTGRFGTTDIGLAVAVVVGASQALALLPGLSRSGLTIAVALALGVYRRSAAEYSFVLAIPTILSATLVQGALVMRSAEPVTLSFSAFAVGFVVAAGVGVVALLAVLRLLLTARFRYFTPYVWALAVVVLVVDPGKPF